MKKIIAMLLAVVMLMGLCACGQEAPAEVCTCLTGCYQSGRIHFSVLSWRSYHDNFINSSNFSW